MGLPIIDTPAQNAGTVVSHQMPGTGVPHEEEARLAQENLAQVARKIGILSGKGGVGKTFLTVNLALALAASGKRVGLLDADIDCPNVARFLDLREQPLIGTPEGRITPLEHAGLKIVSTHFLTDDARAPMIVRGPIKHKVLAELLTNVEWGALDALLLDLPPGTADVPMSAMLLTGLDGVIIVTTPSKESYLDARKSALMARELNVPVLGIVENMTGDVFGRGAARDLARELGVAHLGVIPLSREIRELSQGGRAALVELPALASVTQALMTAALGSSAGDLTLTRRSFWSRIMAR